MLIMESVSGSSPSIYKNLSILARAGRSGIFFPFRPEDIVVMLNGLLSESVNNLVERWRKERFFLGNEI